MHVAGNIEELTRLQLYHLLDQPVLVVLSPRHYDGR